MISFPNNGIASHQVTSAKTNMPPAQAAFNLVSRGRNGIANNATHARHEIINKLYPINLRITLQ